VVDCVSDVATIADALDIQRFAVCGGSGGGPHALAVAARLPERVSRVACVVGGAPYDAEDLDWFDGMDPVNVREFGWALTGEGVLAPELQRQAQESLDRVDEDPTALLADVELSESDRTVLSGRPRKYSADLWRKSLTDDESGGRWQGRVLTGWF
jgi:pimeloyl-ACP methyl ester carboxylesterase